MSDTDFLIFELLQRKEISVRAFTVCKYARLVNIRAILDYYKAHDDFMRLRNVGKKVNEELVTFCRNQLAPEARSATTAYEIEDDGLKGLTNLQLSLLDTFADVSYKKLTHYKSISFVNLILKDNLSFTNIYSRLLVRKQEIITALPPFGKKVSKEILCFIIDVYHFYSFITQNNNIYSAIDFVAKSMGLENLEVGKNKHLINLLSKEDEFHLFKFIEALILKGKLLSPRELEVFMSRSGFIKNHLPKRLKTIGDGLGITRERARQLAKSSEEKYFAYIRKLADVLHIITSFSGNWWQFNEDLVVVDIKLCELWNKREDVKFSPLFYAHTLELLNAPGYRLFNLVNEENETIYFMVTEEICQIFDFADFGKKTLETVRAYWREEMEIAWTSYLMNFVRCDQVPNQLTRISDTCKIILHQTCSTHIHFKSPNILVLKRNFSVTLAEAVENILADKGEPMSLYEIYEIIIAENIVPCAGVNPLRRAISKKKHKFIYFGRRSVYGLKEWENNRADLKSGTIRRLVDEFLETAGEPRHIDAILLEVRRFRPSVSKRSLISNLQLRRDESLVYLGNSFWAKNSKK